MREPPLTNWTLEAIDLESSDPAVLQLDRILRTAVESSPSASSIPTEAQLINQLGVSRVTLRKVLRSLQQDDLVDASAVRGWFVV